MLKTGEVICPECGFLIEEDDCIDIGYATEYTELYKVGHCTGCDKEYKWHEHYVYAGYADLKES